MGYIDSLMGKEKDKQSAEQPEMTALEKRIAEKAAAEACEESKPVGPKTIREAQAMIDDLNDRLVRQAADLENFRKRSQREKAEARQFANQGLLEKLLPVLYNFEMALVAAGDAEPAIRDGVQMIYDQLLGVLKESGVEVVDAVGETFDPNLHEAISQQHTDEAAEGTVLQQVQCGYKLNDRLVRPARVIVAAAPVEEAEPTDN